MALNQNMNGAGVREHFRRVGAAYLVLLISLIPTVIAYQRVKDSVAERDLERFEQLVRITQEGLEGNLEHYLDGLLGVAGFCASQSELREEEWRSFWRNARFTQRFPAFRGVAFLESVTATNKAAHTARVRALGNPTYAIQPEGDRADYFPLQFEATPEDQPWLAPGQDLLADERLRVAILKARARNELVSAISFPMRRQRDTNMEPAVAVVVPVLGEGLPAAAPPARRPALKGVVLGVFTWERLLSVPGGDRADAQLALEILEETPSAAIHYRSDLRASVGRARFSRSLALPVADQKWTLRLFSQPAFEAKSRTWVAAVALGVGLTVNLLLFGITWSQSVGRAEAERLTEDLRTVLERDRLLERATNDAIWDWDTLTHRLVWNEALQVMFRYPADAVRPHLDWWLARLHPDDRRRVWNGREAAVQTGGEFWADEYRFRRGDGTYASVIDRGYIIHDREGIAVRMIGSMVDISLQKEAEEARQRSERKLALHIQQTPLAVIEWNLEFQVTAWNPAAERIFGYTAREALGRRAPDLLVPEPAQSANPTLFSHLLSGQGTPATLRERAEKTWEEILSATRPEDQDARKTRLIRRSINALAIRNRTKEGRINVCDWYNTPLIDSSGQVIGVASLVLEVTARKQAEDALAAEKERLAVTLRSIGDGVIATDTDGRISIMNKLAESLTGWRQADAMSQPLDRVFNVIHQRTRQPYRNPVSQVLNTGEIVDLPEQSMLASRDGGERIIAASAAPIRDKGSQIVGSVLVFRDITDQQSIIEERIRASKLDSLGILAGGIAHDFNNILTAVIGNISFARLFSNPGDKQFGRLEEAEKAALRAKDLATQLLTFAKGGAPVKQTASLTELIRDSTGFAIRGSNVRCEFSAEPELWPVEVDQGQISQVINNLVINAVQSMPDGGVMQVSARNIVLEADSNVALPPGRFCKITVRDHGVGIATEHLGKVFDPYFTTKEKGTGLGLATSYSIIKKHDGLITVDSVRGAGSEFHVFLPASDKAVAPVPVVKNEPIQGHGKVLVMDDEAIICELAKAALEFLGYQVDTVADGEACIEFYSLARTNGAPYDAVVMDLTIPGGMGGKETLKRLIELDPEVRAIVSSGYSHGPEMANYREHGFRGMVGKPYRIEELATALKSVIAGNGS